MNVDKRESVRKVLRTKAAVTMDDGAEPMLVNTTDIGKFGMCLINIQKPITMGQHIRVTFDIFFGGDIHKVDLSARVAYCFYNDGEGYKAGLQFLDLASEGVNIVAQYIAR
jgi:hypothetical protein